MIAPPMEAAAPPARIHHQPPPVRPRRGAATRVAAAIPTRQMMRAVAPNSPRTTISALIAATTRVTRSAVSEIKLDFAGRACRRGDVERQRTVLNRRSVDPEQDHRALDRAVGGRRLARGQLVAALERATQLQGEQTVARQRLESVANRVDDGEVARKLRRRAPLVVDPHEDA